jgi:hypothetical protein
MDDQKVLREQVLALLRGGNAHMVFDDGVRDFPEDAINRQPPNVDYTPWHLLEHIRITQWDILEFVRNPQHISPSWPEGHWPPPGQQATWQDWQQTLDRFHQDMADMQALVADPAVDLLAPLLHAPDYNLLREALLVADHNAYHLGEFGILRQIMNTWPPQH